MDDLSDRDLALILAGLFELRIACLEDDALCAEIDALAVRLGGDPDAMFFSVDPKARP
jgi:hypothetical protein